MIYGGSSRIICFLAMQSASAHALISSEENSRMRGGLVVPGEVGEGGKKATIRDCTLVHIREC